jgi:hypothetical protein
MRQLGLMRFLLLCGLAIPVVYRTYEVPESWPLGLLLYVVFSAPMFFPSSPSDMSVANGADGSAAACGDGGCAAGI